MILLLYHQVSYSFAVAPETGKALYISYLMDLLRTIIFQDFERNGGEINNYFLKDGFQEMA